MKRRLLLFILPLLLLFSCSKNDVTTPPYNYDVNLKGTEAIADTVMRQLEGLYRITTGSDKLGVEFVCKVSKHRVSFFSDKEGIFIILNYGFNPVDSSIQFAGFWRYSQQTLQGNIGMSISKSQGSMDLKSMMGADNIQFTTSFLDQDLLLSNSIFKFERHFSQYAKDHPYLIFGHHGVQTTANPPFAENSLDGVRNVEDYGCNALEFDIRMTLDKVPICIHDPSVNIRNDLKGPLIGDYDQYTFAELNTYVRLRDGQKIPSVEEVIDVFLNETNMKILEFDIKGNPGIFDIMEPIVKRGYEKAAALHRDVVLVADMADYDVLNEYKNSTSYRTLPTMVDMSIQDCIDIGAKYFTPRYTQGLLLEDVDKAHSLGIQVVSWTLNDAGLIYDYITQGRFDGLLSDYPAYINYDFYTTH